MSGRVLRSPSGEKTVAAGRGVLCVGHRGARAFAPENTLEAFSKAAQMGCDMIELDVHLTRDSEVVVHHDDRLMRCTNVESQFPGRAKDFLSEFTLAELRALDAGGWFANELTRAPAGRQPFVRSLSDEEMRAHVSESEIEHYRSGAVRIPTLRESLELASRSNLMVNIELKTIPRMYPRIAETVVDLVREVRMERSVLISSFDHVQLLSVRSVAPEICTGVLSSDRLACPGAYLRLLDSDAYHPGCYDDFDSLGFGSVSGLLDPRGLREVRAEGLMSFVWTCNDPSNIRSLVAEGVTGIITDYPNRVAGVLLHKSSLSGSAE